MVETDFNKYFTCNMRFRCKEYNKCCMNPEDIEAFAGIKSAEVLAHPRKFQKEIRKWIQEDFEENGCCNYEPNWFANLLEKFRRY